MTAVLRSDRRRLTRRCKAKIAELDLPPVLKLGRLKKQLEAQRGRDIWVLPEPSLPTEITGVWVGTAERDYVLFREDLVAFRLNTTILHELSHMIFSHRSASIEDQAWLRQQLPGLNLLVEGEIEHVCMRADHGSDDEREAEMLASLLLARTDLAGRPAPAAPGDTAEDRVARVFRS